MSRDVQLCVVQVDQQQYVVDIARVEEIIPVPKITAVPRAPSFLEGVTKLRAEVLPVVDLRRRLGMAPLTGDAKTLRLQRLVVCRIGRRRVGFVVDAVQQVIWVEPASLRPAPFSSAPGQAPHVLGVCGDEARLMLMLDVKVLVDEGAFGPMP